MNRKPNDLKEAMKRLRVHEPLKLREPSQATAKEAPHNEVPLGPNPTSEVEVPRIKTAHIEGSRNKAAQSKAPFAELPSAEVSKGVMPQSEAARTKLAQNKKSRKKRPQIEAANSEHPPSEVPQSCERRTRGFFKLPHSIFADSRMREISGDAFRLFLWLCSRAWRFPDSDGTVRASVSFMVAHTGIPHATVSRTLKQMKELDLIQVARTDYKRGNLWRVEPFYFGPDPGNGDEPDELPQSEVAQNENEGTSERMSQSLKLRHKEPQFEHDHKKIINIKTDQIPEVFRKHIENIPISRREKELTCLVNLLGRFREEDIWLAYEFLTTNGTLGTGKKCLSPFCYLEKGIAGVLSKVENSLHSKPIPLRASQAPILDTQFQTSEIEISKETVEQAVEAFDKGLTVAEQQLFLEQFKESQYPHGIFPPQSVVRNLAALSWIQYPGQWGGESRYSFC